MYKLVLTYDDRRAMDWIGGRYVHGAELFTILCRVDWPVNWDDHDDMELEIPEPIAWEIRELLEDCHYDCTPDLGVKLEEFLSQIV